MAKRSRPLKGHTEVQLHWLQMINFGAFKVEGQGQKIFFGHTWTSTQKIHWNWSPSETLFPNYFQLLFSAILQISIAVAELKYVNLSCLSRDSWKKLLCCLCSWILFLVQINQCPTLNTALLLYTTILNFYSLGESEEAEWQNELWPHLCQGSSSFHTHSEECRTSLWRVFHLNSEREKKTEQFVKI